MTSFVAIMLAFTGDAAADPSVPEYLRSAVGYKNHSIPSGDGGHWPAYSTTSSAAIWLPPVAFVGFVAACRRLFVREPAAKKALLKYRDVHNVIASLGSLALFAATLYHLSARPLSVWGMTCAPASPAPWYEAAWYLSKVYEWVDTAMLIAGDRPLSSLHYNHHMTTAALAAMHLVGRHGRSSVFDVPLLLNGLVHVFMYAYYVRPHALRPLKRLITAMQIGQHATVLLILAYTTTAFASGVACDISPLANGFSILAYAMYLCQFLQFYVSTYTPIARSKAA